MKKYNTTSRRHALEREFKERKNALLKIGIILGIVVAVAIFGSFAWFTMSREVEGSGVQMTASDLPFELKVSDGNIGYSGLYQFLDDSFSKNTSLVTTPAEGGDTIRWRISGENDAIKPGSQGVLEFTIVSNHTDVSKIHYHLAVQCYTASVTVSDNAETVTGLSEITASSSHTADEKAGAGHLKSHLMFFKERTGQTESTYQYSGFIDPADADGFVLTPELITNTVNEYSAKIYWVWSNTIGQILLDSAQEADRSYLGTGVSSLLNSTGEINDRTKITAYLGDNASSVFSGTASFSNLIATLYSSRSASPQVSYQTEYNTLSAGYNAADLIIGKNVDYISVLLNASIN